MRFVRISLLVASVGLLCCGCFPLRRLSTPGVSGVVVNSQTRSPISNVQVVVSPIYHSGPSVDEVITNKGARTGVTGSRAIDAALGCKPRKIKTRYVWNE